MGKANFTKEFKLDDIKQITERGYFVADVSRRLGVRVIPPKDHGCSRSVLPRFKKKIMMERV